ncbi:hypothetical protein CTZ27_34125 [Streptomyces griseocarneus]|nr:hypothetical protein CTZ27_34125 [Streptomyces griseocarneus]
MCGSVAWARPATVDPQPRAERGWHPGGRNRTPSRWSRGDTGQAFPIYITAIAALLFLALAFFAVGQAGANKNGAQTAADAAALAAAQSYRDQLSTGLLGALAGGTWGDWLNGRSGDPGTACGEADAYARDNGAELVGDCAATGLLPAAFEVTVRASEPVGRSVVPGTENTHATARARAVVEPRCAGIPAESRKPPVDIVCDGRVVTIDPAHPDDLARAARGLFAVRLADRVG